MLLQTAAQPQDDPALPEPCAPNPTDNTDGVMGEQKPSCLPGLRTALTDPQEQTNLRQGRAHWESQQAPLALLSTSQEFLWQ